MTIPQWENCIFCPRRRRPWRPPRATRRGRHHPQRDALLPARVEVGEGERSLSIIPTVPLEDGRHLLMINTAIEDLAGNRIGRPFDVDTFERVSERIQNAFVSLSFEFRNK